MVDNIQSSLQNKGPDCAIDALMGQIRCLNEHIQQTRQELSSLRHKQEQNFNDMNDELDAINISIQTATHKILDETEALESFAEFVQEKHRDNFQFHITNIYEACTFQDMSGQRLKKIIQALQYVENHLQSFFSDKWERNYESPPISENSTKDSLLNGPQLPENAAKQEDIDKFF